MAPRTDKPELDLDRLAEAHVQTANIFSEEVKQLADFLAARLDAELTDEEAAALIATYHAKLLARELQSGGKFLASRVRSRLHREQATREREAKRAAEEKAKLGRAERSWRKIWGRGVADAIKAAGQYGTHAAFATFDAVALGASDECWLFTDHDRAQRVTRYLREAGVPVSDRYDSGLHEIVGGYLGRTLGPEGRDLKIRAVDPDQSEVDKLAERGRAKAAEQAERERERERDESRRRRELAVYGVEVSE